MSQQRPTVECISSEAEDSSEEGDSRIDNSEKSVVTKDDIFSPPEMKDMLDVFFDGIKQLNSSAKTRKYKTIKGYAGKCFKGVDESTLNKFTKSYAFYMKKFNNKPSFEVDEHAFNFMLNNNIEILHQYDDYPKTTTKKSVLYAKLNNMSADFKNMPKEELEQLEAFKSRREDELAKPLLAKIENRIRTLKKKYFGEKTDRKKKAGDDSNPSSAKKSKQEPLTVYDLFVRSLKGKYDYLEPEKRERKLQKKFDQLPPEQLEVYKKCFGAL